MYQIVPVSPKQSDLCRMSVWVLIWIHVQDTCMQTTTRGRLLTYQSESPTSRKSIAKLRLWHGYYSRTGTRSIIMRWITGLPMVRKFSMQQILSFILYTCKCQNVVLKSITWLFYANLSCNVKCDYSQTNIFWQRKRRHRNQLSFELLFRNGQEINFCGLKPSVTNHIMHRSFQ